MLKRVVAKIAGGIGNQLFQLTAGLGLSTKFNAALEIDETSYMGYTYHHKPEITQLGLSLKKYIFEIHDQATTFLLRDKGLTSLEQINNIPAECETLVLEGYWQSEGFILPQSLFLYETILTEKYRKKFAEFTARAPIRPSDVAIHIRRRDYTHLGLVSDEYYIAIINYLRTTDNITDIAVFSDEPNYSLHFLGRSGILGCKAIATGDDWFDLFIMSQFRQLVIANSTFSWWGARLFESQLNKRVFHPDPWVLVDPELRPCPDRWIRIRGAVEERRLDKNKLTGLITQLTEAILPERTS